VGDPLSILIKIIKKWLGGKLNKRPTSAKKLINSSNGK